MRGGGSGPSLHLLEVTITHGVRADTGTTLPNCSPESRRDVNLALHTRSSPQVYGRSVVSGVGAGLDESAYLLRLPPCTNIDAQEKLYLSVIMGNTALDHEDLYYLGVGNGLLNRKRKSPEMGININPSITQVSMQVVTRVANMSCLYFHWDRLRCLGPVAFSVSFNPTILRPRSFHCNDNLRSSRRRRHIVQSQSTARTVWSL